MLNLVSVALPDTMLNFSLCSLDERYQKDTLELRAYLTTPALVKARIYVQLEYLLALCSQPMFSKSTFTERPQIDSPIIQLFESYVTSFSEEDYLAICKIEQKIGHDVKAIEYYLQKLFQQVGLERFIPFLRFGVTSEDDTNLAYGILINRVLHDIIASPLYDLHNELKAKSEQWSNEWMLGHTHGQPATPLSIGSRLAVWWERLEPLVGKVTSFKMHGKFGGAVGNRLAHQIACPEVDWNAFGERFVRSLGLKPIFSTTQINPHQDLAELSHLMSRITTVLIDFCQNMWLYIHDGVFCLQAEKDAVGSSVMPHKVNPQNFETAEGSLILANALWNCFANELPKSRMERHLSDSILQRSLGEAFGYFLLGVKKILKNLKVVYVNTAANKERIATHPEIWSEAIQTVMRRYGYDNAYEQLKDITRGKIVSATELAAFVATLERVPQEAQDRLLALLQGDLTQLHS